MKSLDDGKRLKSHAFVCTNQRTDGREACHEFGGHEFFTKLKQKVKDSNLQGVHKVTRSGCLSYCNKVGCTLVIYRKDGPTTWLTEVTDADFETVWAQLTS